MLLLCCSTLNHTFRQFHSEIIIVSHNSVTSTILFNHCGPCDHGSGLDLAKSCSLSLDPTDFHHQSPAIRSNALNEETNPHNWWLVSCLYQWWEESRPFYLPFGSYRRSWFFSKFPPLGNHQKYGFRAVATKSWLPAKVTLHTATNPHVLVALVWLVVVLKCVFPSSGSVRCHGGVCFAFAWTATTIWYLWL